MDMPGGRGGRSLRTAIVQYGFFAWGRWTPSHRMPSGPESFSTETPASMSPSAARVRCADAPCPWRDRRPVSQPRTLRAVAPPADPGA